MRRGRLRSSTDRWWRGKGITEQRAGRELATKGDTDRLSPEEETGGDHCGGRLAA
jgi:hypothetical protein